METPTRIGLALVKALRSKKILTIEELCEIAQRSPMTVWRILKPIGYYTSFNCNARYYTLVETPRFDADNLWFFRDIGFSSYGSLNRAIVGLVESSTMGMTPNELSAVLRVRVQNQLHHLFAQQKVDRVPWRRAYLYLSVEEEVREQQLRRHQARRERSVPVGGGPVPLTDSETIAILAELVRTPRFSVRRIATVLAARGLAVTHPKVLAVIEKYDLTKKRASRRSRS